MKNLFKKLGNLQEVNFEKIFDFLTSKTVIISFFVIFFAYLISHTSNTFLGDYILTFPKLLKDQTRSIKRTYIRPFPINNLNNIIQRNIFDSTKKGLKLKEDLKKEIKKEPPKIDYNKAAVKTTLGFSLLGTIAGESPYTGIAVIAVKSNDVNSYVVGDKFGKVAKLIEIHREKIIFEHNNRLEYLEIPKKEIKRRRRRHRRRGDKGTKPLPKRKKTPVTLSTAEDELKEMVKKEGFERSGYNSIITQSFRNQFLNDRLAETLRAAKATPVVEKGEIVGWRMNRIKPSSIYKDIGVKENDIIEEINGTRLDDAGKAVGFLNTLKSEPNIQIKIRRNSRSIILGVKTK